MHAAVLHSDVQLWLFFQQQRAAMHVKAGVGAGFAKYTYRACNHAAAAIIAGIAFNQDQAAPHLVASALAGIAFNDHCAAQHAFTQAFRASPQKITGITVDSEQAATHAACRKCGSIAFAQYCSVFHAQTQIGTGVTFNGDAAAGHIGANVIESVAGIFKDQLLAIAAGDFKYVTDMHGIFAVAELDCANLVD